jgi:predicted ArsR family transcriptional regulator
MRAVNNEGMSTTTVGYSAISSYSRVELLGLLSERAGRTIAELSDATGLHANTVREHLHRLEADGLVVRTTEHRTTRGRPRVLFTAVLGETSVSSPVAKRKVRAAAARGDIMRRLIPDAEPDTRDLGLDVLHQLDAVVEHLSDAGFDPAFDGTDLTLDVTPCPHQSAQAGHRETLCAVHLGIMQGVLAEAGGPLRAIAVRTDGVQNGCIVQLLCTPHAA